MPVGKKMICECKLGDMQEIYGLFTSLEVNAVPAFQLLLDTIWMLKRLTLFLRLLCGFLTHGKHSETYIHM